MPKEFVKLFKDRKNLETLATLVSKGYSSSAIAHHLGCDHSSVDYHVKKHGLIYGKKTSLPKLTQKVEKVKPQRIPKSLNDTALNDYYWESGEKINVGKSYAQYRAIEQGKKDKLEEKKLKALLRKER